jgi:hypothetical protein
MFKIEITEHVDIQKTREKEWVKLHDNEDGHHPETNPQYGYRQADGTRTITVEREVLSQTVDTLDLVAVIKAINGIAS